MTPPDLPDPWQQDDAPDWRDTMLRGCFSRAAWIALVLATVALAAWGYTSHQSAASDVCLCGGKGN